MSLKKALNIGPSRIEIAYEHFGDNAAPPVVLIMGLGGQMIGWNEGFCNELVNRRLQVIRFDNRDVGLSTHLSASPMPDFKAALAGDTSSAAYNLSDMAADTIGLLEALGLKSAHIVGASMGGFIAQTMAIEYPESVRSLTSMMATTGDRSVGQPAPDVMRLLFSGSSPATREEVIERAVIASRLVGSPGFPRNDDEVRERAGLAYDRSYDQLGIIRQSIAVLVSGDRTAQLRSIKVPTLVIHGADDRMCDVSGGRATAGAIVGAELEVIEGMGHNIPRVLWPRIASLISGLVQRVEGTI
jgi:pimeloyl-ACP methyl ester carboxylesterase